MKQQNDKMLKSIYQPRYNTTQSKTFNTNIMLKYYLKKKNLNVHKTDYNM